MGFVNHDNLAYIKQKIINLIPTKTSQLTNDSGYLTEVANMPTVTTATTIGSRNTSYVSAWSGRIDVTAIGSVKHATCYLQLTVNALSKETAYTLATINTGYRPVHRQQLSVSMVQGHAFIDTDGTVKVYSSVAVTASSVLYISGTWIIS